jgi:hypothetical protein
MWKLTLFRRTAAGGYVYLAGSLILIATKYMLFRRQDTRQKPFGETARALLSWLSGSRAEVQGTQ